MKNRQTAARTSAGSLFQKMLGMYKPRWKRGCRVQFWVHGTWNRGLTDVVAMDKINSMYNVHYYSQYSFLLLAVSLTDWR